MNTQENRIKVFVNDSRENYSVLTYSENGLSFNEKVIDNIDHIDLYLYVVLRVRMAVIIVYIIYTLCILILSQKMELIYFN